MTRDQVIEFLRRHQPLSADEDLSERDLRDLDCARKYLEAHPDVEAVDLLLGVFGDGDGFGVYQLLENAVSVHDASAVVPALERRLRDGPRSVQYWCAQIAAQFPDDRLVPSLRGLLRVGDYDLRWAALMALEAFGTPVALAALESWLPNESEPDLREIIQDAVGR